MTKSSQLFFQWFKKNFRLSFLTKAGRIFQNITGDQLTYTPIMWFIEPSKTDCSTSNWMKMSKIFWSGQLFFTIFAKRAIQSLRERTISTRLLRQLQPWRFLRILTLLRLMMRLSSKEWLIWLWILLSLYKRYGKMSGQMTSFVRRFILITIFRTYSIFFGHPTQSSKTWRLEEALLI